ncbi:MAG: ATP-binding cassette domain-containing protein [Firmicutes bacterium]|nr:ATP-binding cassette domain-containing protein [Bacillota bacterium]
MKSKPPKLLTAFKKEGFKKAFYFCAALVALVLIWWVWAETVFKSNAGVPSPPEVFGGLFTAAMSGKLWIAAFKTLSKAFLGFVISFLLGLVLAVLANWFKRVKYCLDPIVTIARAFPTLGVTFLLLMYFGTGVTAVIIGILVIFPVFYAAFYAAIKNIDPKILQMADVYRVGKIARVFKIYLPSISSAVFAAVLSAFALNLKVVIAAEIVGGVAPNTVGNFMSIAIAENNYAGVFTWVLAAILLAFLAEGIIKLAMRLCMPWEYRKGELGSRKGELGSRKEEGGSTDNAVGMSNPSITPHSSLLTPHSTTIPPCITFDSVTFSYPATRVFKNFSANFSPGKIHCIFGPSGSGKTTLLNLVAGLYKPQSGKVNCQGDGGILTTYVSGRQNTPTSDVRTLDSGQNTPVPLTTSISYMFQEARLILERTVLKNLTLVLEPVLIRAGKTRKEARAEAKARSLAMLDAVGLGSAANLYPRSLSGGMAQRVSLARAFIVPSQILLMDEPFRGLDYSLQKSVRALFLSLLEQHPKTVLLVTHDAGEAVMLSDEIHRFCKFSPVTAFSEIAVALPRSDRKIGGPELAAVKEQLVCD